MEKNRIIGNQPPPQQLELFEVGILLGYIRRVLNEVLYHPGLILDDALKIHCNDWYIWFMNNTNAYWNDLDFMINTCIVEEYRKEVKNALKK